MGLFESLGELAQVASESFGQGALYDTGHDDERIASHDGKTYRVHMADGMGVYGIWHSFIRAAMVQGADVERWIEFDRLVALSYLIHSKINPIQSFQFPGGDDPSNSPLKQRLDWTGIGEILDQCRPIGLVNSFDELDRILLNAFFGRYPF